MHCLSFPSAAMLMNSTHVPLCIYFLFTHPPRVCTHIYIVPCTHTMYIHNDTHIHSYIATCMYTYNSIYMCMHVAVYVVCTCVYVNVCALPLCVDCHIVTLSTISVKQLVRKGTRQGPENGYVCMYASQGKMRAENGCVVCISMCIYTY